MSPSARASFAREREFNNRTQPKKLQAGDAARVPKQNTLRRTVKLILTLQLEGQTRAEIGQALGLSPRTIATYLQRAGKRGLIPHKSQVDPRDRIDYVLTHKALDRIEAAIDDPDKDRAQAMAFKVADATVFKSYDHDKTPTAPTTNVLAIKIEPSGPAQPLREGSVGGTPGYIEGDVEE